MRYHGPHCRNNGRRGRTPVGAAILPPATFRIQPVWLNGTTHRHVIPREQSESRNLPKLQVLSCVGSSPNVVDSSTPLRYGRNDNGGTFLRIRLQFLERFTLPRGPHQARPGEPASPKGSSCSVSGGILLHSYVVVTGRFPERHTGHSLRFRLWVVPFNLTGCIRNVAGGRLPPLRSRW